MSPALVPTMRTKSDKRKLPYLLSNIGEKISAVILLVIVIFCLLSSLFPLLQVLPFWGLGASASLCCFSPQVSEASCFCAHSWLNLSFHDPVSLAAALVYGTLPPVFEGRGRAFFLEGRWTVAYLLGVRLSVSLGCLPRVVQNLQPKGIPTQGSKLSANTCAVSTMCKLGKRPAFPGCCEPTSHFSGCLGLLMSLNSDGPKPQASPGQSPPFCHSPLLVCVGAIIFFMNLIVSLFCFSEITQSLCSLFLFLVLLLICSVNIFFSATVREFCFCCTALLSAKCLMHLDCVLIRHQVSLLMCQQLLFFFTVPYLQYFTRRRKNFSLER